MKTKDKLYALLRDINNGMFSQDTLDDIVSMATLFAECGLDAPSETKNKKSFELYEKKAAIKQVYLAHLSLIKYELSDAERVRAASEILGCNDCVTSYALWAKYLHHSFPARDFLNIAKTLLSEPVSEQYSQKHTVCLARLKEIRPKVLFFGAKKELIK